MTKKEGVLTIVIFSLVCFSICLICYEWQARQNVMRYVQRLETEIFEMKAENKEKNEDQDELIGSAIRQMALCGVFDKKDGGDK